MSQIPVYKRGDTFLVGWEALVGGVVMPIHGWQISSTIRTAAGWHVADLEVEIGDAELGIFWLNGDTSTWPLGLLKFDVLLVTDAGQRISSATVSVQIIKGETQP